MMRLTDADREAWALYEAQNKAATEQYRAMPIAHNHAAYHPCLTCGTKTNARAGVCRGCREGA